MSEPPGNTANSSILSKAERVAIMNADNEAGTRPTCMLLLLT